MDPAETKNSIISKSKPETGHMYQTHFLFCSLFFSFAIYLYLTHSIYTGTFNITRAPKGISLLQLTSFEEKFSKQDRYLAFTSAASR